MNVVETNCFDMASFKKTNIGTPYIVSAEKRELKFNGIQTSVI